MWLLVIFYERILRWCLAHRLLFMTIPLATLVCGVLIWRQCGQEFMPTLDEGSFMLMPTSMPHTGVEENIRYCKILDRRIKAIPEVNHASVYYDRSTGAPYIEIKLDREKLSRYGIQVGDV